MGIEGEKKIDVSLLLIVPFKIHLASKQAWTMIHTL